ncbi:MAG: chitobiase/beta-hexosaminidase C-terminal domain-containing protein, partial [Bacteroidales bacterium]|nr:chitobiase/beta-hexosaminidase C-terminal domain-containing protein [Bacteroidales bacterium]
MTRILHTLRLTALCLTAVLLSSVSVYADDTVSETFIFNTSTGLKAMGFDVSSLDQIPNLDLEENHAYSIGGNVSFSNNNNGTPTCIFKDINGALTLRIYNGAQLTFSVPEGCFIERINFTRSGSNFNLSPISGNYYWNASEQVSSITFNADGSTYLQQVEVLYTRPSSSEASVAAPTFSPAACTFTQRPFQVSLSCATEGASIYYTTDGSTPDANNGTLYTPSSPIVLTNTTTVKAIAVLNDVASNVAVATYTYDPVAENHPALFQVVTNVSEITADHTYLIGSANTNKGYVLGYQKPDNRQAVAATITDGQLSVEKLASDKSDTSNPYPLTFIPDGTGKFLIKDMVSGNYLACGTGQKNKLLSTPQGYAASVVIDAENNATLILSNTSNAGHCY